MKYLYYIFLSLAIVSCSSDDNSTTAPVDPIDPIDPVLPTSLYFPEATVSSNWETVSPSTLNWNESNIDELCTYLDQTNTKGFIILKDGKIALEKYFNGHTINAINPWFSAVKSLTATAIGIAQDEGYININTKTSNYLGENWSSLTTDQQDLITVKHHLTMTTGLLNNQQNFVAWTSTSPIYMQYSVPPQTVWTYHQGAFTQLQNMLTQSTGTSFESYIYDKILEKTGMSGSWDSVTTLNIFSSNTRSMARFGLLSLNKGNWDGEQIVSEGYFDEMTNTSQTINQAYGYLWWLNGKNSFVTTNNNTYTGSLIPNAPNDMFAALGAQDQKIYVIPSTNMVVIRCGDQTGLSGLASSSYDNLLWEKINQVIN